MLNTDVGTQRARAGDNERTALAITLYTLTPLLLLAIVAVALFVVLRNWKRSPVYKLYTWQ